jgi:hypothetical protein
MPPDTPIEAELPVLPENLRKGLLVFPELKCSNYQAVTVVSSVSLVTTLSLLVYLAFTRLISRKKGAKSHVQGLFWLINLFIAGLVLSTSF